MSEKAPKKRSKPESKYVQQLTVRALKTFTGFYGDKILYKNLDFFDNNFVPTFCRRRFRNALYGEKILLGKSLGTVSTNLSKLFYAGEMQNLNCKGWKWQRIFS